MQIIARHTIKNIMKANLYKTVLFTLTFVLAIIILNSFTLAAQMLRGGGIVRARGLCSSNSNLGI